MNRFHLWNKYVLNKECLYKLQKTSIYKIDETSFMENKIGYHRIKSNNKSISLHIYSPPNHKMKLYN
jgi:hypothetical protein